MQSITACPTLTTASHDNIRPIAPFWMVGVAALMLGGCVSQQTYDTARHEAKTRAGELAQIQTDIQSLEHQREEAQLANQRDERALASLKHDLKKIQVSYDQLHKSNQAKLAALEHNIAALRARHQAMLKEINDTKRLEKRLETLTAQQEQATTATPSGPETHITMVGGNPQESQLVAVITPQSPQVDPTSALTQPPAPQTAPVQPTPATPHPEPVVAAATPASSPVAVTQAPVPPQTPRPTTATATQEESWFSSVTGWFTSLFDWIWA